MKDPEFIELRNRWGMAILAGLLFLIPAIMAFNNAFGNNHSEVYEKILKKDDFIIFVESKKCSKCNFIENLLDTKNISYYVMNIDKDNSYYEILKRLDLNEEEVLTPGIIYVENGNLKSYIFDLKKEDTLDNYIEINELKNIKG